MNWNMWIRQAHRWVSIAFTLTVLANFVALSRGTGMPPPWVTYSPLPYYVAPPPQTNTLGAGTPLIFRGEYTFVDVNQNRIPDSWEQEKFSEVSPGRTAQTDTDSDGMTDLSEFTAGTNPNDFNSKFQVATVEVLASNRVRINWPSMDGKSYLILGSTDGKTWKAYSSVVPSGGSQTTYTLTLTAGSRLNLFKIEVLP